MDKCGYVWWFFRRLLGNQTKQAALEEAEPPHFVPSPVHHTDRYIFISCDALQKKTNKITVPEGSLWDRSFFTKLCCRAGPLSLQFRILILFFFFFSENTHVAKMDLQTNFQLCHNPVLKKPCFIQRAFTEEFCCPESWGDSWRKGPSLLDFFCFSLYFSLLLFPVTCLMTCR